MLTRCARVLPLRYNGFQGLETEKKILAALKQALPHNPPIMRDLGQYTETCKDDDGNEHVFKSSVVQCADFDAFEGIAQIMLNDSAAQQDVLVANQRWANGTGGAAAQPDTIADFDDSLNFLEHDAFRDGIPEGIIRIPVAVMADEADVCMGSYAQPPPTSHPLRSPLIVKCVSMPAELQYRWRICREVQDIQLRDQDSVFAQGGAFAAQVHCPRLLRD